MLRVTVPIPEFVPTDFESVVIAEFEAVAGTVAVEGVRDVLGTSGLGLDLSEPYATRKAEGKIKGMKRIEGKDLDQPGILTGALYEGVNSQVEPGIGFSVVVAEDAGVSTDGDDYAADLEARTQYLEKGIAPVEDKMLGLLESVLGAVIAEANL